LPAAHGLIECSNDKRAPSGSNSIVSMMKYGLLFLRGLNRFSVVSSSVLLSLSLSVASAFTSPARSVSCVVHQVETNGVALPPHR
jgi:hypothetical protein